MFVGWTFVDGKQTRTVVACSSQRELSHIVNESLYYVRQMWGETGNEDQIVLALKTPRIQVYPLGAGRL